jgi:hypothetical protein
MRRWVPLLVALALATAVSRTVAAPPAPAPGGETSTPLAEQRRPDFPNIAILAAIDGARPRRAADSLAFVAGLYEAFDADYYLTESVVAESSRVTLPLHNRFRLVHGDPFGDEWQVRVMVEGWTIHDPQTAPRAGGSDSTATARANAGDDPPETRWGLIVAVSALSPDSAAAGAHPRPERARLVLHVPREPHAEWFAHAGRMVGRLAVEALHHRSGDLDADTRVRLDRAERSPEGPPPPPGR